MTTRPDDLLYDRGKREERDRILKFIEDYATTVHASMERKDLNEGQSAFFTGRWIASIDLISMIQKYESYPR